MARGEILRRTTAGAGAADGVRWQNSSLPTLCWREMDSNLYGAFPVKWCFSVYCQFFVRSGRRVLRPVACDQVPGARGRGQGTETLGKLGGVPPSGARVWQRLDA